MARAAVSDAMNFLNEVVMSYPQAISFGPGRPLESLFDVRAALDQVSAFATDYGRLGQYGETNGIIRDDIARYLRSDEGITAEAKDIVVTVGAQEAMLIVLVGLFDPARDVLLIADPAYVGMSGPAAMLGIEIHAVPQGLDGLDPEAVAAAAAEVRAKGRVPRGLYHVPTFNNPLGTVMTLQARQRLLEVAAEHDLLIFEDNAYGAFAYDADPPPTLMSLDHAGRVIYLGSFSKTLFPGLRVGFLVDRSDRVASFGRVKSFTTLNTSPVMQAVVGGVLRNHGHSLRAIVEPKRALYRQHRDQMLASLAAHMPSNVTWNRPSGGFFLTVALPFPFGDECVRTCARDFGVICAPMQYFTSTRSWNNVVRLAFSYVTIDQIERGIASLAAFIASKS